MCAAKYLSKSTKYCKSIDKQMNHHEKKEEIFLISKKEFNESMENSTKESLSN